METELQRDVSIPSTRKAKEGTKKKVITFISVLLSVLLWCTVAYASYYIVVQKINATEAKVETQLTQIQQQMNTNTVKMEESLLGIQEEMSLIKKELTLIEEDLTLTGETLSGSNGTKIALQERMKALDLQLSNLQKSIARLEDASR